MTNCPGTGDNMNEPSNTQRTNWNNSL